jgi:hypothetical protein
MVAHQATGDVMPQRSNLFKSHWSNQWLTYVQLGLAYLLPTASIDIYPGTVPNEIKLCSKGVIPVALLGSVYLDVTQVNLTRVHFGSNGTEAMPVHTAIEDVNQDGTPDLVLQFKTPQTGFQCGQYAGILQFYTLSNQLYIGADSIITVGCN